MQIYLEKKNIQTRVIFTGNILRQPMMKGLEFKSNNIGYPNSDAVMERGVLLPIHHGMTDNMFNRLHDVIDEFLLSKNYIVHGIKRRSSSFNTGRIDHLYQDPHENNPKFILHYGDLTDSTNLIRLIKDIEPDEIYNLAAQSHVRISFDIPQFTAHTNAVGVLNMLEAFRQSAPNARFYQASSSEMFGSSVDDDDYQRETTPFNPVSPYGCAKVFGYNICRNYRNSYGLHIVNGILFNHESPRRGSNFVTNKVVKTAVEIKKGLKDKLELGNMDSYRDWGHSKDYVRAMHMIINHDSPDDFVVATGETHSVREMTDYVFSKLEMDYKDYVVQNPKYIRPEELKYLRGDCSKLKSTFDWKPEYNFEALMDEMIDFWMKTI